MDNWPVMLVLALALGGGVFLLSRPLPPDYKNGEYRRHLTRQEQAALKRGEVVEKTHKAYQTIWKSYYDEGPLRVIPAADGKHIFVPYGHWKRLMDSGQLMADFNPSMSYQESYWHEYHSNGQRHFSMYTRPVIQAGDTIDEIRTVFFALDNPADTAYVQHFFSKNNKEVKKSFISFDAQGQKPVPPGWKPNR